MKNFLYKNFDQKGINMTYGKKMSISIDLYHLAINSMNLRKPSIRITILKST